jgi:hypothetical protein
VEQVFAASLVGGSSITKSRVIHLFKSCNVGKCLVYKGQEWLASCTHPLPNPLVPLGRPSPPGTLRHFRALCGFFIEQRCHPKLGAPIRAGLIGVVGVTERIVKR